MPTVDSELTDVDRRLEVAERYRSLLKGSLFDEAAEDAASVLVDREVQDFVRRRLGELLGMGAGSEPPLTDHEIRSVRALLAGRPAPPPQGPKKRPAAAPAREPAVTAPQIVQEVAQPGRAPTRSPHAIPTPTGAQLTAITMTQAADQVAEVEGGGGMLSNVVAAATKIANRKE
jgi:hypothetical protein